MKGVFERHELGERAQTSAWAGSDGEEARRVLPRRRRLTLRRPPPLITVAMAPRSSVREFTCPPAGGARAPREAGAAMPGGGTAGGMDGSAVRFHTQRARLQICELQTSVDAQICEFSAQQEVRAATRGQTLPAVRAEPPPPVPPVPPHQDPTCGAARTPPKILANRRNLMADLVKACFC